MSAPESEPGAFRHVPFTGVIFVVHEAMKRGFENDHPDGSNLGLDVHPGRLRAGASSYGDSMRCSFGPPLDTMRLCLSRLERTLGG
ncbi:MAG: hypothetical protein OES32_03465 [Acidobacteriota bacterium]|nr:hypothetical protein [Acidobacteriota bacterium]MDH3522622.1 hypothetical protein [Acidobacteriota bacterium]